MTQERATNTAPGQAVRRCGACTRCCRTLAVSALQKPMNVWCDHCRVGAGCAIYPDRPEECRVFACQWLVDPGIPESLRPDRSGVVLHGEDDGRRLVARCDPDDPLAWRREPMLSGLMALARKVHGTGRQVLAVAGPRVWLIAASQIVDLGELEPDARISVEPMPDGTMQVRVAPPATSG